jgi:hypothetical protein
MHAIIHQWLSLEIQLLSGCAAKGSAQLEEGGFKLLLCIYTVEPINFHYKRQ